MTFIAGLVGGAMVILAFVGGVVFGRSLVRPVKVQELTEQALLERERITEDRNAFRDMMNYNADTAYKKGGAEI